MFIFQHLHVACKTPHSSMRQLGNTSENIRWFKCTVHIHICTSDVKCNQLQYLHNWVNSDFVHILLCRLLHQVRGNKAEPSEKVMSIGTWRNTWGICRKRKKMSSHELHKRTERSSTAPQQTKSLLTVNNRCDKLADPGEYKSSPNRGFGVPSSLLSSGFEQCRGIVCKDVSSRIQGFFHRARSFLGEVLTVSRVHREREGTGQRGSVRDRILRAGHPAGLSRGSPGSARKLQSAISVLCRNYQDWSGTLCGSGEHREFVKTT